MTTEEPEFTYLRIEPGITLSPSPASREWTALMLQRAPTIDVVEAVARRWGSFEWTVNGITYRVTKR